MTHPHWQDQDRGRPPHPHPWGFTASHPDGDGDRDRVGRPFVQLGMPPIADRSEAQCPYCGETFYGLPLTDPLKDHVEHCPRNPANLLPAPAGSSLAVGRAPVQRAGDEAYAITVATITQFAAVLGHQVHDYGYELIQLIAIASETDRDRLSLAYPTEVFAFRYWTQGDTRPTVGELVTFLRSIHDVPGDRLSAGARERLERHGNPDDA